MEVKGFNQGKKPMAANEEVCVEMGASFSNRHSKVVWEALDGKEQKRVGDRGTLMTAEGN